MCRVLLCSCLMLPGLLAAEARADDPLAVTAPAEPDPRLVEAIRQAGGQINRVEAGHIVSMAFYHEQARTSSRFEFLKQLEHLQELAVHYTASAEWIESISQLPELRTLTTYRGNITDQALGQLQTVKSLRHLDLEVSPVTDAGLQALVGLPHLETLRLRHLPVTDAGLETVSRLPALRKLSLDSLQITPAGILALRDAPIEELTWWDEHRPRLAYVPFVKQMKHLKRLDLASLYVQDDVAEHLREMQTLEALDLYDHRLSDAGLRKVAELTHLRTLNLSLGFAQYRKDYRDPFSERDLEQLTRLKELRSLGLGNTAVTDAGLRQVAKLTQLRSLTLGHTKVTATGLAALGALPHLETLDITGTAAVAEPQVDLRMLKGLKTVYADGVDERKILVPAGCAVITFD